MTQCIVQILPMSWYCAGSFFNFFSSSTTLFLFVCCSVFSKSFKTSLPLLMNSYHWFDCELSFHHNFNNLWPRLGHCHLGLPTMAECSTLMQQTLAFNHVVQSKKLKLQSSSKLILLPGIWAFFLKPWRMVSGNFVFCTELLTRHKAFSLHLDDCVFLCMCSFIKERQRVNMYAFHCFSVKHLWYCCHCNYYLFVPELQTLTPIITTRALFLHQSFVCWLLLEAYFEVHWSANTITNWCHCRG